MTDDDSHVKGRFGPPVRYAFKSNPMKMYVQNTNGGFYQVDAYAVTFERACDMFDIHSIGHDYKHMYRYLTSCMEPGLTGEEVSCYFSHSVVLDEVLYSRLMEYANTKNCRGYTGVIDGYSVMQVKMADSSVRCNNTGLYLEDVFIRQGGLSKPAVPFNETKHKRFLQALESYRIKETKKLAKVKSTTNIEIMNDENMLATG